MESTESRVIGTRLACDRCHIQKLRCSNPSAKSGYRCTRCERLGVNCQYSPSVRIGRPRKAEGRQKQLLALDNSGAGFNGRDGVVQVHTAEDIRNSNGEEGPAQDEEASLALQNVQMLLTPAFDNFINGNPIEAEQWTGSPQEPHGDDAGAWIGIMEDAMDYHPHLRPSSRTNAQEFSTCLDETRHSMLDTSSERENQPSGITAIVDCMKQLSDLQLILYDYSNSLSLILSTSMAPSGSQINASHGATASTTRVYEHGEPSATNTETTVGIDEVLLASQKLIDIINGPLLRSTTSVASSNIDTSFGKLPDSATILLVLTCYTRLLHIYDLIISSWPAQGTPNELISIGSFLLPPSSGIQMTIITQLVLHLFDHIDKAIGVNISSSYRHYASRNLRDSETRNPEGQRQWGGASIAALEVVMREVRISEHSLSKKLRSLGQKV